MANNLEHPTEPTTPNAPAKDKKASEPLFGPSIGSVSCGPAWTIASEKKVIRDELTPDTIAAWVEKSKDASQPTTTLQALVNLKRPTLRLSPLHAAVDDPSSVDHDHHGLEFEYDCDAPKCGIYVHVFLPKTHPDVPPTPSHYPLCRVLVYENTFEGGFGNRLRLEDGAALELGRFESPNGNRGAENGSRDHLPGEGLNEPSSSGGDALGDGALASSHANNSHAGNTNTGTGSNSNINNAGNSNGSNTPAARNARRRFTAFHFRKRNQNASVAGPALAVVDAESAVQEGAGAKKETKDDGSEEGVRISIRLAALDEQGCELGSPNEQITYLHIVRFGPKAEGLQALAAGTEGASGNATGGNAAGPTETGATEDTRPWVVRVVKREATIGPHTFQLQEIFGLSSTSVHPATPTAPPPSANHTYPPEDGNSTPNAGVEEDDPQSECLLCLSSPREVVLLPCRHLVACKECALNMVEFGAGGTITQAGPEGGEDVGGANGGTGTVGGVTTMGTSPAPGAGTNPRRKRKAKGWFCPVCRQPYTSMLRITTAAPPVAEHKEGDGSGSEDEAAPVTIPMATMTLDGTSPANANTPADARPGTANSSSGGGLLGGALRPGFLRGLSLSRSSSTPTAGQNDVENQAGLARVGA